MRGILYLYPARVGDKLLCANLYECAFSRPVLTDNSDMLPFVQCKICVYRKQDE